MVFECRQNIRNQPVSTAIPSTNSFCDITTLGTLQHLGKIFKDISRFFFIFQDSMALIQTRTQESIILSSLIIGFHSYTQELVCVFSSNKFFLFIINLRILSFSHVRFSLRPIQVLKHLGLPQHLPTPPINNRTIDLPILTGKESASLGYFIDIIFKTELQQVCPAHNHTKNSELTVQPRIRLSTTRYKRCQWLSYHEQVILSFSQVRFTLRLTLIFKRQGHLLIPPTNKTTTFTHS